MDGPKDQRVPGQPGSAAVRFSLGGESPRRSYFLTRIQQMKDAEYSPAEAQGRREFPVGQASRLPSNDLQPQARYPRHSP